MKERKCRLMLLLIFILIYGSIMQSSHINYTKNDKSKSNNYDNHNDNDKINANNNNIRHNNHHNIHQQIHIAICIIGQIKQLELQSKLDTIIIIKIKIKIIVFNIIIYMLLVF